MLFLRASGHFPRKYSARLKDIGDDLPGGGRLHATGISCGYSLSRLLNATVAVLRAPGYREGNQNQRRD